MKWDDIRIFRTMPPRSLKHPDLGVYLEPILAARQPSRSVISTTLFCFPFSKRYASYETSFGRYIEGLHRLLSRVATAYPAWNVRLYVDYSLALLSDKGPKVLRSLAQEITRLHRVYPFFEVIAARLPGIDQGRTFLPSMWRFLAAFDPDVDVTVFTDLDQVVHPLYMHYVEQWRSHSKAPMLVLYPSNYNVEWCASGLLWNDPENLICPNAQLCAVRAPLSPRVWQKTLEHVLSKDMHLWTRALYGPSELRVRLEADPAWIQWLSLYAAKPTEARATYPARLRSILERMVQEDATPVRLRESLRVILSREDLFRLTVLFTERTRWLDHPVLKFLENVPDNTVMKEMFFSQGYGVDEWGLQVWMHELGPRVHIRTTPKDVLDFHPHVRILCRPSIPDFLTFLLLRLKRFESTKTPQHATTLSSSEYVARMLLIASALRCSNDAPAATRAECQRLQQALVRNAWTLIRNGIPEVTAEQFRNGALDSFRDQVERWADLRKSMWYTPTEALPALKKKGVSHDGKTKSFFVSTPEGLRWMWGLMRDGLLMEVNVLHSVANDDVHDEFFTFNYQWPLQHKKIDGRKL